MIEYLTTAKHIHPEQLSGFFVGWNNPPDERTLLNILHGSNYVVVAMNERNNVVGFVTAISDGILSAYIPLLEVLPDYQHQGVGSELVRRIMGELKKYYMIDLSCDEELELFYTRFGMTRSVAMSKRNYDHESGK